VHPVVTFTVCFPLWIFSFCSGVKMSAICDLGRTSDVSRLFVLLLRSQVVSLSRLSVVSLGPGGSPDFLFLIVGRFSLC